MNSRKRKGQLESMIGKIFVLSLFLILFVNLIVPNKEKSEEEKWRYLLQIYIALRALDGQSVLGCPKG